MIIRALAFIGGLGGAAVLSQYPEFAQQYTQRLAGQVDALSAVVEDFDATALRSELTRGEALAQMQGTPFLEDRRADMIRTFARHQALAAHHLALTEASPMERLLMPHRLGDVQVFRGTWEDFVPALPLTAAGGVAAATGFIGGWVLSGFVAALFLWPFRRLLRRRAPARSVPVETAPPPPAPSGAFRPEPPLTKANRTQPLLQPGE